VMNGNNWTCDAGQMRGEMDFHNPYSMGDSESAVKGECCQETCHSVMNANNWTCDAGHMPREKTDFHNPYWMGDSESAVKGACCVQTCHSVMKDRTLTCGPGMSTRDIDDYHEPSGGWHQSDDIILYECCQAPPACLVSCVGLCGVIPNGDPSISWCECFNSNCWAPSGALESCPETTFDADDEDNATKDDIINYIYDDPEGFKCVKPDFPPGTGVSMPKKCGGGLYVHRKNRPGETCKECAAGKFSKTDKKRNRRCKKCGKNRYQNKKGSTSCIKCPPGFNTKGQRGKKQCFDSSTGKSMKQLGMYGWNQK